MLLIQCVDDRLASRRIFDAPSIDDFEMREMSVVCSRRKVQLVLRGRIWDVIVLCSRNNWFTHISMIICKYVSDWRKYSKKNKLLKQASPSHEAV